MLTCNPACTMTPPFGVRAPHVDQYKSSRGVQLIVYLTAGPGTRVYDAVPAAEIEAVTSRLVGVATVDSRIATVCGGLLLDRQDLDRHLGEARSVTLGDVCVLRGDRIHSAPSSSSRRAVLFLMFDDMQEFTHYDHDMQMNRIDCLIQFLQEVAPKLADSGREHACAEVSKAIVAIGTDERQEAPWSILEGSDYEACRQIGCVLAALPQPPRPTRSSGRSGVVGAVRELLLQLLVDVD